ncbi:MAG: spoIIIAA [Bacilli bacterium]|nr:spoIIIAA [Bacilli bacterium]
MSDAHYSYDYLLPPAWKQAIQTLPLAFCLELEEFRVRVDLPLQIVARGISLYLHPSGQFKSEIPVSYKVSEQDIRYVLQIATQSSLYAVEEELRRGFLTVKGGHRIGVAGRVVLDQRGAVENMKDIRFLNIRIARSVPNVALSIKPFLFDPVRLRPLSTLIISPPGCGKTTMLRDLARQWSNGTMHPKIKHLNVSLVDERSELAGSYLGVPQLDVGTHTDVLDGCPKAEGLMMMIRSMAPDVIVTDEIGRAQDRDALLEAVHSGVTVLATVHGSGMSDLAKRPVMQDLMQQRVFQRYLLLSRRRGPCTLEGIWDEHGRNLRKVSEEIPC